MIREGGLYVLMGSKPICTFPIDNGFPETEEERKEYYEEQVRESKIRRPELPPMDYETFNERCKKTLHRQDRRLWKIWKTKMNSHVSPRYKFFIRFPSVGDRREEGFFINVPNAIGLLKTHYEIFCKETGIRFDPDTIFEEFEDENSLFWEKVFFQSHYLAGLLLGYGEKNASVFDWLVRTGFSLPRLKIEGQRNPRESVAIRGKKKVSLSDLLLPQFNVYFIHDQTVEQYKKEREYIVKELKGRDYLEKIMQRLTVPEKP